MIVVEKEGKSIVHDGNRRMIKHIIEQKDHATVHYGKVINKPEIYNHWVPTSLMMSLAKHANIFYDNENEKAALSLIHALANISRYSEVARTELDIRVLGFMDDDRRKEVEQELQRVWSE